MSALEVKRAFIVLPQRRAHLGSGGRLSGLVAVSECMRRLAKQLELGG
jgi:hypothetical protein